MNRAAPQRTLVHLCRILASAGQRKHLLRWLRSRDPNYVLEAEIPWLTFDAVDELLKRLPPNPVVFEYGSGGSTLFWLKHHAQCTSVEHDARWCAAVRERVGDCERLDYRLVPPEHKPVNDIRDPTDPHAYCSADPLLAQFIFEKYVNQIDVFPDRHFDVVLVDGRARPSCLMRGAAKVKPGGLLILDNAERDYYTERTKPYLQDFTRTGFFGVGPTTRTMWRTDLYERQ